MLITIFRYEDAYGNWTYNTCTTKDSDEGQPWSVINICELLPNLLIQISG